MSLQQASNGNLVITPGDPITASNQQNFLSLADSTNVSGKFAALDFAVGGGVNPISGSIDQQRWAAGTTGVAPVSTESTKSTFSFAVSVTLAATATDFLTIFGSGTKTVRILRLSISGLSTGGSTVDIFAVKRSSTNTGGTSSAVTPVPHDSNNPSPTCSVANYTANPSSLGTAVGNLRQRKLNLGAAAAAGLIDWHSSDVNDQAFVLRGTSQGLCLNFNGQTVPAGTALDVEGTFVEDNS